jgi:hypothetical protein
MAVFDGEGAVVADDGAVEIFVLQHAEETLDEVGIGSSATQVSTTRHGREAVVAEVRRVLEVLGQGPAAPPSSRKS